MNPTASPIELSSVDITSRHERLRLRSREGMEVLGRRNVEGLEVTRLSVDDGYETIRTCLPDGTTVGREEISGMAKELEGTLLEAYEAVRQNPEMATERGEVIRGLKPLIFSKDEDSCMTRWAEGMPSARALYPLQRPTGGVLHDGTPIDAYAEAVFCHMPDAIGIRTRAEIMAACALELSRKLKGDVEWMSLACGAAIPVLDALEKFKAEFPDKKAKLTLVDIDESALAFAEQLAEEQGLEHGADFTTERADLIAELIMSSKLAEGRRGSMDMIDMLGIFEYMRDGAAARMLKNAQEMLKPGGVMVIGNMLKSHPNLRVNQDLIEWPSIRPRDLNDMRGILEKAGIDLDNVSVFIPEDEVYAVFAITKPSPEDDDLPTSKVASLKLQPSS